MPRRRTTRTDDQMAWYPYYPADFEQGTADLTLAEVGAFQRLMNAQWAKTGIPADNVPKLAAILRCSTATARSLWKTLSAKFTRGEDGLWRNPRLAREREQALAVRHAARENGARGAQTRWQNDSPHNDSPLANGSQKDSHPIPSLLADARQKDGSSQSPSEDQNKERSDLPPVILLAHAALAGRFEVFWAEYPRKKARGAAWKAWQKLKPSAELASQMLTAVRAQRSSREWREGFIPHPATWLNQERWSDQDDTQGAADKPSIPFWDECPTCGDIHPVGAKCAPPSEQPAKADAA